MVEESILSSLTARLQSFFTSSEHTDLIIRAHGKEIKVHKIVMCAQSNYFARMLGSTWKETVDGVITLQEDDVESVDKMVRFMYGYDYDPEKRGWRVDAARIVLDAKMYVIADKYDVTVLKELSKDRFEKYFQSYSNFWDDEAFPEIAFHVFENTPSTEVDLRKIIRERVLEHVNYLMYTQEDQFVCALQQTPSLLADIIKYLAQGPPGKKYVCDDCTKVWRLGISAASAYCPVCKKKLDSCEDSL